MQQEHVLKPIEDVFGPLSEPISEHIRLPPTVQVQFIDTPKGLNELKQLIGARWIGVDAEWRCQIHKW